VGIVTSPTGAVIRDFLNIVSRRHAGLHVLLYPALVQGDAAAAEVAAGIAYFNRTREADVIVIARGGGSLEDLAPFNSELLAESIAASELPIISAVGHETDFTIADFVADLRAPTPSAAAELVTTALYNIADRVQGLDQRLVRSCRYRLLQASGAVARVRVESILMRGMDQLRHRQQRVDDLSARLESHCRARYRAASERLRGLTERLVVHDVIARTGIARERLGALDARIARAAQEYLRVSGERQAGLDRELNALSPLAVLNRGYALVFDDAGHLIKTTLNITENQSLVIRLARGRIRTRVSQIEEKPTDL
jgi:exodeoxyribonuclease VII large subunit